MLITFAWSVLLVWSFPLQRIVLHARGCIGYMQDDRYGIRKQRTCRSSYCEESIALRPSHIRHRNEILSAGNTCEFYTMMLFRFYDILGTSPCGISYILHSIVRRLQSSLCQLLFLSYCFYGYYSHRRFAVGVLICLFYWNLNE